MVERNVCRFFSIIILLKLTMTNGSQFSSHVTINTPARSFTHGVGHVIPSGLAMRWQPRRTPFRSLQRSYFPQFGESRGYERYMPSIPFNNEETPHDNSLFAWQQNNNYDNVIPLLPVSPYKVDSPDPESLWPEGLFLPPSSPHTASRRSGQVLSEQAAADPYLLEGSEATAAVERAEQHGSLYFHDIPHIASLLENQQLREANHLPPHIIASIRLTWPYNRT